MPPLSCRRLLLPHCCCCCCRHRRPTGPGRAPLRRRLPLAVVWCSSFPIHPSSSPEHFFGGCLLVVLLCRACVRAAPPAHRDRGSRASRSPSPNRLNDSTVM